MVRFCRLTEVNSDGRQCIQGDHVVYKLGEPGGSGRREQNMATGWSIDED